MRSLNSFESMVLLHGSYYFERETYHVPTALATPLLTGNMISTDIEQRSIATLRKEQPCSVTLWPTTLAFGNLVDNVFLQKSQIENSDQSHEK